MSTCDRCKHGPSKTVKGFDTNQEPSLIAHLEEAQIFASSGTFCQVYQPDRPFELAEHEIMPDTCPHFEDRGNRLVKCTRCGELTPVACHSHTLSGAGVCANCAKGDVWCFAQCNGGAERVQCAHWIWLRQDATEVNDLSLAPNGLSLASNGTITAWRREAPAGSNVGLPDELISSTILANMRVGATGRSPLHVDESDTTADAESVDAVLGMVNEIEFIDYHVHDGSDVHTHNQRGIGYVALGNYELALADMERAIALNPNFAPSYFNRGNLHANLGDFEQALADYNRAVQLDEHNSNFYVHRGRVNAELQRFEEAVADYHCALELDPELAEVYFWLGLVHFELDEYEKAIADYTTLLEYTPNMVEVYLSRGRAYVALGEYSQALDDYNKVVSLAPQNVAGYDNRAQVFALSEEFERALDDFDKALELAPQSVLVYAHRGRTYAGMGEYEKALADFAQAIELNPQIPEPYLWQAGVYMNVRRISQAISALNKVIEMAPDYALAYARRGDAYLAMNTQRRALTDYTRAINLDPHLDEAYHHRGIVHSLLDHLEKALADLTRTIELTPSDPWPYFTRGNIYAEMVKFESAIADYTRAIDLHPDIPNFYTGRGHVYAELEEYQPALSDLTRAIELEPTTASSYFARGTVYTDMEKYTLALADYNKAAELDPQAEEIFNHRARILVLMGRYAEAIADFNRAIALNEYYLEAYFRRGQVYHEEFKEVYRFNLPFTYQFDMSERERTRWLALSRAEGRYPHNAEEPDNPEDIIRLTREKYLQTLIAQYELTNLVDEIIWVNEAAAEAAGLGEIAVFSIWNVATGRARIFFHCAVQRYMGSDWRQIAAFTIAHERYLIEKLAATVSAGFKPAPTAADLASYVRTRLSDWERYAYLRNLQPDNLAALGIAPDVQMVYRAWNELVRALSEDEAGEEWMEETLAAYREEYGADIQEQLFLNTPNLLEWRVRDTEQSEYYDVEAMNLPEAINQFTERIEQEPNSAQNYERRGLFYLLFTDDYDAALTDFTRAIELDPENAVYHYHRGTVYFLRGEYDAAIADFNRVVADMPDLAGGYARRGEAYLSIHDNAAAIADFSRAIELDPTVADFYLGRADAYSNERAYEEALADFTMSIELDPEETEAYFQRAIIYRRMGQPLKALADWEKLFALRADLDHLDIMPDLPVLYYYRAHWRLYVDKDYSAALRDLNRALELNPEYDDAYHLRSHYYTEIEQYDVAIADLERALEINPANPNHYNCLAYIYADILKINLEEATALAQHAVATEPDNAHFLDTLGWVYYLRGMWTEAYELLSQSAAALPDNEEVQEHWRAVQLQMNPRRHTKAHEGTWRDTKAYE